MTRTAPDLFDRFRVIDFYETDFPHPSCQYPNAYAPSRYPRDYAADALSSLSDVLLSKVLHDNAASLYGLS